MVNVNMTKVTESKHVFVPVGNLKINQKIDEIEKKLQTVENEQLQMKSEVTQK